MEGQAPACPMGVYALKSMLGWRCKRIRASGSLPLHFCLAVFLLNTGVCEDWASVRIEPNVEKVPANHLKFYLHFSKPMERGEAFRFLRLVEVNDSGKEIAEVPEPFREVELWDETFTRMTLWFHPGRQKPGVNLNVDIGPILEEGRSYRLEISPAWKTESGAKLGGSLEKVFEAAEMDDNQPDPATWGSGYGIDAKGRSVILIHTGETLDPESARRRIQVVVEGEAIDFEVRNNQLAFVPPQKKVDSFRVVIDPRLEDLAGNSVARPFNLDLDSNPNFQERTDPVELLFPRKIRLSGDSEFPGKVEKKKN